MQWFYNLKTSTKLWATFGIVSLLTATVGFVGLSGLRAMDRMLVKIYEDQAVAGRYLKEASADMRAIARFMRNAVAADADETNKIDKEIAAISKADEAARAGEQGRGFAVVAAEVRNLAQRSATAAKEIKALIQDSVAKVEAGSRLVNQSGQTLEEIVSSVKRVTDIIGEIAAASQEQTSGIDQVNRAVGQMDHVVQSNAAQTEEMTSTAQSLATQAEQLQELVGKFRFASEGRRGEPAGARVAAKVKGGVTVKKEAGRPAPKAQGPLSVFPHGGNGAANRHNGAFEEF